MSPQTFVLEVVSAAIGALIALAIYEHLRGRE